MKKVKRLKSVLMFAVFFGMASFSYADCEYCDTLLQGLMNGCKAVLDAKLQYCAKQTLIDYIQCVDDAQAKFMDCATMALNKTEECFHECQRHEP